MRVLLFLLLATCTVLGQVAKRPVTEAEYKLWSTMDGQQLSEGGKWVSYAVHYESGKDTLFVKHIKTLKTQVFARGTDGRFINDHFFMCRNMDGNLIVTNLISGKQQQYKGISNYAVAMSGKVLVMLQSDGTNPGDLLIADINGKLLKTLSKVSLYSLNPTLTMLVCDAEKKLQMFALTELSNVTEIDSKEHEYNAFSWQANGASFAYLAEGSFGSVGYYQLKEKQLYIFDRTQFIQFLKDSELCHSSTAELGVSDDGKRIFFGIKEKEPAIDTTGVQLWNTADKMLYPWRTSVKGWAGRPKLGVWFPEQQQFKMVSDADFPYQVMLPGQQSALVYNPITHEPQFDRDAPIDYYLKHITTDELQLILPKFSADQNKIGVSRTGRFIAYFKEKQWWVYDVQTGQHSGLTSKTGQSFIEEKYDRSGEVKVSGIAGWTTNDEALLVYDTYDLWMLKTDGSSAIRLTKGREKSIVYRLVQKKTYLSGDAALNEVLNLNDGLLLEGISSVKSGYFVWNLKNGLQPIIWEGNRIGGIKQSANGVYCFIREHYHISPELVIRSKANKTKVVYQSNTQQQNHEWGFSKLITYEDSKGQQLHGALFYPAGYNADKSYPMVVYIYERLSDFYNQYVNPSLLNQEGFNISNLTANGYFVLLPDIAYNKGETGKSALDCVTAAVDEVLAHESVDSKRLGLVGHSFGGYEVNYIVTQTDRFATVVSGSGMSDIINSYLTVGWNISVPNYWRYEFNQSRMGKSLFDDYQNYIDNSPITFAKQVQTPVLLWSGAADFQVHYYQSLEFHMALRRLQKPNILLLYERERHTIMEKAHQIDLTHKSQEWFDYYLKGASKPNWFAPDKL